MKQSLIMVLKQLLYQKGFRDDICGDITPHVPSTRSLGWCIWCHAPGNVCWQKLPTDIFWPVTAKPRTGLDRNQGQQPWLPMHQYFQCTKVTGQFWNTVTYVTLLYISRSHETYRPSAGYGLYRTKATPLTFLCMHKTKGCFLGPH